MNNKFTIISIVAVLISFAGGFMLANALNRSEMTKLQASNAQLKKDMESPKKKGEGLDLSEEEIKAKIAEAEKNPKDFAFQKGLGLALYRFAAVKEDTDLFDDVTKLLERANQINPDDYQVIVSLGNIYYDLGQIKKEEESNLKAREYYGKALAKNAKDTNVLTDYALTFLLTKNPDREKAISEFENALEVNPKNEKALIYMTQAQAENENIEEANKYLTKLKEVNPKSERLSALETLISQKNK